MLAGIAVADLDFERLEAVRGKMPIDQHRCVGGGGSCLCECVFFWHVIQLLDTLPEGVIRAKVQACSFLH